MWVQVPFHHPRRQLAPWRAIRQDIAVVVSRQVVWLPHQELQQV